MGGASITVGPFSVVEGQTGTFAYSASWPNYPGLGFANAYFFVSEGPASTDLSDAPFVDQAREASTSGSLSYTAYGDGQIYVTLSFSGGPMHIDHFEVAGVALDDGDPGVELSGDWQNDHFLKNVHRVQDGTGEEQATWTIGGLTPGEAYALQALWDPLGTGTLSNHVRYEVWDGGTLVGLRYLAQNDWPSALDNVRIDDANLGFYRADTDTLTVKVFAEPGTNLLADAIRILHIPGNRGDDDNFHLAGSSPAVDSGDPQSYFLGERLPNGASQSRIRR